MRLNTLQKGLVAVRYPGGKLCRLGDAWSILFHHDTYNKGMCWRGLLIHDVDLKTRQVWLKAEVYGRSRKAVLAMLKAEEQS